MKYLLSIILLLATSKIIFGQFPKPLSPPRLYNNFSTLKILSATEEAEIEAILVKFEAETSNEIAVIVIDDLNDLEPWEYATEIGEKWGVGKAEEDNGIILLIKPTEKTSRREVFIAVGRGLESVVPDLTANEIVENELLPNFKNQAYFEGVKQAVKVLSELSKGEYSHNKYSKKNKKGDFLSGIFTVLFILILVILLIKRGGGGTTIGAAGFIGGFGRSFGGGYGGGSSGGGFGGFGGGSFGGGGSGGSW
jgi:uncharacterized protein